jgi:hypothetical protein
MLRLFRGGGAFAALALLALPGAALSAGETSAVTEKKPEKLVCRKLSETGSLVKKNKVCLTRAQWERSQSYHSEYGAKLQDDLRGRPAGGP